VPGPDFVIRSSRVVAGDALAPASIHVRRGLIARVAPFDDIGEAARLVDCGEDVVMAGLVDSHVHVNEPGRAEWEGFESATRAAAAGGITTIVDMPLNSIPPTTSVAALETKLQALEGKCHVDVGLWGGAVPGNSVELPALLRAGALGFKCFLVDSGVEEFRHLERDDLRRTLDVLASTKAPLLVHAELPEALVRPAGVASRYKSWLDSRPPAAEDEAVALVYAMNQSTRTRVHVVHLSSAGSLDILRRARDEEMPLTAETTPHYLHLTAEAVPDRATQYKCAPPIREAPNRERLWEALAEGVIGCIVSDHSPCTPGLKHLDDGDFVAAWGGIASLQIVLPIVWHEAQRRGIPLARITKWLCEAPATLAGLSSRKGRIAAGCDADFVVWNPEEEFVVDPDRLEHRHKVTPYAGETLHGVVKTTYLRGDVIYSKDGFGSPRGEWLRGSLSP